MLCVCVLGGGGGGRGRGECRLGALLCCEGRFKVRVEKDGRADAHVCMYACLWSGHVGEWTDGQLEKDTGRHACMCTRENIKIQWPGGQARTLAVPVGSRGRGERRELEVVDGRGVHHQGAVVLVGGWLVGWGGVACFGVCGRIYLQTANEAHQHAQTHTFSLPMYK